MSGVLREREEGTSEGVRARCRERKEVGNESVGGRRVGGVRGRGGREEAWMVWVLTEVCSGRRASGP